MNQMEQLTISRASQGVSLCPHLATCDDVPEETHASLHADSSVFVEQEVSRRCAAPGKQVGQAEPAM